MRTRTELLQSTKTPALSYFANLLFNIFVARSDDMAVKISPIDLSHFRKQFCPGTQINQARVFCLSCTHSLCLGLYVRYFSVTGICKPFFPNSVFPQLRISFCSLDLTWANFGGSQKHSSPGSSQVPASSSKRKLHKTLILLTLVLEIFLEGVSKKLIAQP